jgi:glycosyltransferase involved in cell wall biosynthesis
MKDTEAECIAAAAASLEAARDSDLAIAHELPLAERLLNERRRGQQVWMFVHVPMPVGLYFTWNWAVPEQDWREIAAWPDVSAWIDRELQVWGAVDRVVMATPHALDELVRVDERFRAAGSMEYVLSGGAPPASTARRSRPEIRKTWRLPLDQPVGLYLGNALPYRGFDRLVAGLDRLRDTRAIPGIVAVAGPRPESLPGHERIRALGPVRDVGELMSAVDFFVNVNRFNLFDLSVIEACHAGLPLLMHMTGGNRTLAALGAGHVPVADLTDAAVARGIEECFSMRSEARQAMGRESRAVYDAHLTPAHMARRHLLLHEAAFAAAHA